ncbi:MAG: glycerol-3-phosphate 1-O-acyltransferase PlsY [Candidatus Marinimicrobia bacterium]|nr:glycerol-3-phosphate 1-O-acyltransferase PlsY [Candidatus Neomarinimicrobiota bacterium]MBL7010181.1 glycerol-3-phosphate 1-O-acyltransferase PlsY [Candidatus Neomarinimicrobiota bacterium]MBL7030594.1 glycerol-3-phosphate 1-O-acyltransferase PlsY [Candidatus Neomarinimicrobiota bacterium]
MISLVGLLFASYLVGSTPTSIIMGRLTRGIDIREHGSGNAGGTNVFRVLGWKPALAVLIVDGFKGWFPAAVLASAFFNVQIIPDLGVVQILCGFAAVLGHTFTIFAGFKGGKGVGTLGGMLLALFPSAFLFCLFVAILAIIFTGYVSVASIFASVSLPIFIVILPPFIGTEPAPLSLIIFSLLIPWFIIYTHRSNIQRLRNGEENQFEKAMIFRKKDSD